MAVVGELQPIWYCITEPALLLVPTAGRTSDLATGPYYPLRDSSSSRGRSGLRTPAHYYTRCRRRTTNFRPAADVCVDPVVSDRAYYDEEVFKKEAGYDLKIFDEPQL